MVITINFVLFSKPVTHRAKVLTNVEEGNRLEFRTCVHKGELLISLSRAHFCTFSCSILSLLHIGKLLLCTAESFSDAGLFENLCQL
jgi:hypothetical protein